MSFLQIEETSRPKPIAGQMPVGSLFTTSDYTGMGVFMRVSGLDAGYDWIRVVQIDKGTLYVVRKDRVVVPYTDTYMIGNTHA